MLLLVANTSFSATNIQKVFQFIMNLLKHFLPSYPTYTTYTEKLGLVSM